MQSIKKNLTVKRTGCGHLLAAALQALVPSVHLCGGGATREGFYCDFSLTIPLPPSALALLEERMRQLVKQKIEIQYTEMVPVSAVGYFRAKGQGYREEQILSLAQSLVQIVQIGDFVDLGASQGPSNTAELTFFKLVELVEGDRKRIVGLCFDTLEEVKQQAKKWIPLAERDHRFFVQEQNLLAPLEEGWAWLPQGEICREELVKWWREEVEKLNYHVVSTPGQKLESHLTLHRTQKINCTAELFFTSLDGKGEEGLLDTSEGWVDTAYFSFNLAEIFSSLQLIVKILKIFRFDYEVVFIPQKGVNLRPVLEKGELTWTEEGGESPAILFYLVDILGRRWEGPSLKIDQKNKIVVLSLFYSLERFLALLLEQREGSLPTRFAPEQVRILGKEGEEARALFRTLTDAGFRVKCDVRQEILGKKMHDALRERVPFSIVLGNRKNETGVLSVRCYKTKEPVEMTIDTLISRLKNIEDQ